MEGPIRDQSEQQYKAQAVHMKIISKTWIHHMIYKI